MALAVVICAVADGTASGPIPGEIDGIECISLGVDQASNADLASLADGQVALVAVAFGPGAQARLLQASMTVPRLLAVDSVRGAASVVSLLRDGMAAHEVAYPLLYTPDRLLADQPADRAQAWQLELDQREVEPDGPWLEVKENRVVAAQQVLSPLELEAAQGRVGLPRGGHRQLLIAPANWAGQAAAWAKAVEDHVAGFSGRNVSVRADRRPDPGFTTDVFVDAAAFETPLGRIDLALDLVLPATHVLIEDMIPFLGLDRRSDWSTLPQQSGKEAEMLLASGRDVAVVIHGSSGRAPARHAALYPLSPFADRDRDDTNVYETLTARVLEASGELGVPRFVATLDMLDFVEDATWLPIIIDPANFAPAQAWEPEGRLKVLHMPSDDFKKGTTWVDQILGRLDQEGVIEYRRLAGIHHTLVPALLREIDVVVDQVSLGNVATLANQTMAAGRLSVGLLPGHVRRRYPQDPPVLSADPTNLGDIIWQVAKDPQRFEATAKAGPGFARRFHDGRYSAKVLQDWLAGQDAEESA
ncbi:MAG: hypothetical protein FWD29_02795 [Micrococcales bacterium]|nr:hypothetical protein [Micrococcales bacterium]